jgi:hypothetical protein
MGKGRAFLSAGTPLAWNDSLKFRDYVKQHGIIQVGLLAGASRRSAYARLGWPRACVQFLNIYRRVKDRERDTFMWGDEVPADVLRARVPLPPLSAPRRLRVSCW